MAVETPLTIAGPGEIGDLQTWTVNEAVTPFVVGDPAVTGGSITAQMKASNDPDSDSVFTLGRDGVLTTELSGVADSITGNVQSVNPTGLGSVSLILDTVLSRLSAERSAAPQWADMQNAAFTERGGQPGQVGDLLGVAVDTVRGFVYVSSVINGGSPQTRISKFDLDLEFVLEWAVSDGGSTLTVHPDDGFVYLLDSPNLTIHKYDPDDGTLLASADSVGVYTMVQAIPDSSGDLIVGVISGTVPTLGFMDSNLDWGSTVFMPGPRIVPVSAAIHPVTGDIYVGTSVENAADGSPSIRIFDGSLNLVGEIGYATLHGPVV